MPSSTGQRLAVVVVPVVEPVGVFGATEEDEDEEEKDADEEGIPEEEEEEEKCWNPGVVECCCCCVDDDEEDIFPKPQEEDKALTAATATDSPLTDRLDIVRIIVREDIIIIINRRKNYLLLCRERNRFIKDISMLIDLLFERSIVLRIIMITTIPCYTS